MMMRKASDAVVNATDLVAAIQQIKRGDGPQIMKRLWDTEPQLAAYMEAAAAHLAGTVKPPTGKTTIDMMDELLDFTITIVRAIEMGQLRLWRDILPLPSTPPIPRRKQQDQGENGQNK